MEKLNNVYKKAVQSVKQRIIDDLMTYMEQMETAPSLHNYINDRKAFLQQVWTNVWSNKAASAFTWKEKFQYLLDNGIMVENPEKKLIKRLFRQKIKDYANFDSEKWLEKQYQSNGEDWQNLYENAVKRFEKKISIQKEKQTMLQVDEAILRWAEEFFQVNNEQLFLLVRYATGKQLFLDLQASTKYKLIGSHWQNEKLVANGAFTSGDYKILADFLHEYTGELVAAEDWGRVYYDYEYYGDRYENFVIQSVFDFFSEEFLEERNQLASIYEEITGEALQMGNVSQLLEEELMDIAMDFFNELQDEYVEDLLAFSSSPFSLEKHRALYHQQLTIIEQRRLEEERERQQQIVRENQILANVFEREFQPPTERSVHYILHIGDTNTGKTYQALQKLKAATSGCYLAPLRLLALEIFDTLNQEGVPCSLKTGEEEKIIAGANHIAATVEMFYEKDTFDCIVIDEAQMIADKERGFSWFKAITKANAREVHIIASKNSKGMLLSLLEESSVEVIEYERDTPLEVELQPFKMNQVKKGDALICFSRKKVLETAAYLQQKGKRASMIYGSMPPETRKAQIRKFINGETTVIVSTDAIGMGLNLPIRRIIFLDNEKFDGIKRRRLTSQEVKQIAGRAGRKGIYNIGKVAFMQDISKMKALLTIEDEPLQTFTIAPTSAMFERFQQYSHHLGDFFVLWLKFKNPAGTVKASLTQEMDLYKLVKGTDIEARLSMDDLYGFLHFPFSAYDASLTNLWLETMKAIVSGNELPEPIVKRGNLDEVELSYKAIGLHLLFLYRLGRRTEAYYWERIRTEVSIDANEHLKKAMKKMKKKCKRCGRNLPIDFPFPICDHCHTLNRKPVHVYQK
ncbi:DEAD/DEAH box helicase [Caldibacillus lycopersici]|uniref:DEAD/DEAH box helicase n=1 Tax=Perspicuibacillus lycopersici TaxID=1325689 RepID=A0AAE3IQU7_9BACI|nr:DEAD/DEAH box helicase [Perspicuibacillus lycopersici]MCU9612033.1 DEAD/DEAH box helicase [Perspicuibacillus lycopersici]